MNQVQIFDLKNPHLTKNISYLKPIKDGVELFVKISNDRKRVILSTGVEHYVHNGISQENFPSIEGKFIRGAINDKNEFYLVTCKDYDRDIDILHSNNFEFNASIHRKIEPGSLTVFDYRKVDIK